MAYYYDYNQVSQVRNKEIKIHLNIHEVNSSLDFHCLI